MKVTTLYAYPFITGRVGRGPGVTPFRLVAPWYKGGTNRLRTPIWYNVFIKDGKMLGNTPFDQTCDSNVDRALKLVPQPVGMLFEPNSFTSSQDVYNGNLPYSGKITVLLQSAAGSNPSSIGMPSNFRCFQTQIVNTGIQAVVGVSRANQAGGATSLSINGTIYSCPGGSTSASPYMLIELYTYMNQSSLFPPDEYALWSSVSRNFAACLEYNNTNKGFEINRVGGGLMYDYCEGGRYGSTGDHGNIIILFNDNFPTEV